MVCAIRVHICLLVTCAKKEKKHSPAPAWRIPGRSSMLQPTEHSTGYTSPSWWAHTFPLQSLWFCFFFFFGFSFRVCACVSHLTLLLLLGSKQTPTSELKSLSLNLSACLTDPQHCATTRSIRAGCKMQHLKKPQLLPARNISLSPTSRADVESERWCSCWHPSRTLLPRTGYCSLLFAFLSLTALASRRC